MKLKGLVWFFAIALILISVFQLSFTWVVNSHESNMKAKAERMVRISNPGVKGDEKEDLIKFKLLHLLDSTRDTKIYPLLGTTYQKCKENELNLGLDLQGGMSVTMDVSLEGLLKSMSNNPKDPALLKAIQTATAQKINSNKDYIGLFTAAYKQQNPGATPGFCIEAGRYFPVKSQTPDNRYNPSGPVCRKYPCPVDSAARRFACA